MFAYGDWLEENVLAPLPHRQYVFSLPKLTRPFFRCRRRYLGELCRLVADGVFLPSGRFRVLPPLPEAALCEVLRYKLLDSLRTEGVLEAGLADRMLNWRHSGFSVRNRVRMNAGDAAGRQRLARYMIRCPSASLAGAASALAGAKSTSATCLLAKWWASERSPTKFG